ncbi:hypothetical protein Trydic_g20499 [Trypoxylus dichotomus]
MQARDKSNSNNANSNFPLIEVYKFTSPNCGGGVERQTQRPYLAADALFARIEVGGAGYIDEHEFHRARASNTSAYPWNVRPFSVWRACTRCVGKPCAGGRFNRRVNPSIARCRPSPRT